MLKIRFLTEDPKLIDIVARYWQLDPATGKFTFRVADLANEFQLTVRNIPIVVSSSSIAYDDEKVCTGCGEPSIIFKSREDFLVASRQPRHPNKYADLRQLCQECRRKADEEKQIEDAKKQQEQNQQKQEYLKSLTGKWSIVALDDMSLEQAVFLDAYARVGLAENFDVLLSLTAVLENGHKLAPTRGIEREIVRDLKRSGLLEIHPNTSVEDIGELFPDGNCSFFTRRVYWYFPASNQNPEKVASLLPEIERAFIQRNWPSHWNEEALLLWRKIALWECLE